MSMAAVEATRSVRLASHVLANACAVITGGIQMAVALPTVDTIGLPFTARTFSAKIPDRKEAAMPDSDPLTVYARAFVPVFIQLVTKLLVMLGAFLVTHGLMTDDQLTAGVPVLAQEIVGFLIAFGASGYAAYRSKQNNDKLLAVKTSASTYVPDSVLSVKGTVKDV